MTLPTLTPEQRAEALRKAALARTARAEMKANLKNGRTTLPEVINSADTDIIVGKTKVSAILAALPKVGKFRADKIMADLGISPTRRMRGLGANQREALLSRFGY